MRDTLPASHHLTVRQERFCERIAAGENQTDAWLLAGYKVSREVARRNAAQALRNPKVAAKLAELRKPQTAAAFLTRDRKRRLLMEIVEDENMPLDARLRAIAEDNKMAGHYEPEKIEVEDGPRKAAAIAERAEKLALSLSRFARPRTEPADTSGPADGHPDGNGSNPSPGLSRWNR